MNIGTKYKITSDSFNVVLEERFYNKKQGEYYWKNIGYFGNPRNALKFLVEHDIMGVGFEDFKTVVKRIDELNKVIGGLPHMPPELLRAT